MTRAPNVAGTGEDAGGAQVVSQQEARQQVRRAVEEPSAEVHVVLAGLQALVPGLPPDLVGAPFVRTPIDAAGFA